MGHGAGYKMPSGIIQRVNAAVEAELGDGRVICDRCRCTLATFDKRCCARLDERCQGFDAIDRVRERAFRDAKKAQATEVRA